MIKISLAATEEVRGRICPQAEKAGINRGAVTGLCLEPLVQVGTAGDASGFPLEAGMHNGIAVQFPRCINIGSRNAGLFTHTAEDTQTG